MNEGLSAFFKENRTLLVFLVLMFGFRSAVADWNAVPTGSMRPTIVEGDRIWVNKMAYDLRIPFTHFSILRRAQPARGDIIVFDSKVADKRLVKRVVGLPGDTIRLDHNVVIINGKRGEYQPVHAKDTLSFSETLDGKAHTVAFAPFPTQASTMAQVSVPEGHYFVMGDNRDNSADSRVIGFVPRDEIVGKTSSVVMSLNYDHYYLPRPERFFKPL